MTDESVQAREEHVTVNGVQLFTRCVGQGPDVIVLHGGPGAHHDYLLPFFDRLATGRRLRYYDQRGGGRSAVSRSVDVGWQAQVADLTALIVRWDLEPATIIGYSWGGLLALLFATEHPEQLGRLALISPAPSHAAARQEFERRFAERMAAPAIAKARQDLSESGLRERDPGLYRQRAFELSVAGYFAEPSRASSLTPFRITDRTYRSVWQGLGQYDLRDGLSSIDVPAVVIHGSHDPIPLWSARETASLLNADLVVLDDCGHVPYVEDTEGFVSAINDFLPSSHQ